MGLWIAWGVVISAFAANFLAVYIPGEGMVLVATDGTPRLYSRLAPVGAKCEGQLVGEGSQLLTKTL